MKNALLIAAVSFIVACGGSSSTPTAVTSKFSVAGDLVQGSAVVFDASASSGTDLRFDYDFGDGKRGGSSRLSHVFSSAGDLQAC